MKNLERIVIIGVFLLSLIMPTLDSIIGLDHTPPLFENRKLSTWKTLSDAGMSLSAWVAAMDEYFNDHFGMRRIFVRINNRLRYFVFGVSASDQVLIGKDGWLFYAGQSAIDDYRGLNTLSSDQLKRWLGYLESRRTWLAMRGICYIAVLFPEKTTIYPEYLPRYIKRLESPNQYHQLLEAIRRETDVPVVDLAEALIAHKADGQQLFYKYDSHWNDWGAFIGYREIMKYVGERFPYLSPFNLDHFEKKIAVSKNRDLAHMLSLGALLKEKEIRLVPREPLMSVRLAVGGTDMDPFAREVKNPRLPRAVFLKNSYIKWIEPFISEHFSYIKYYWPRPGEGISYDIEDIVMEDSPDIIIEALGERALIETTPGEVRIPIVRREAREGRDNYHD